MTRDKVKEKIIQKLDPFFTDKAILEKHSMDLLVNEYVLYVKLQASNPTLAIEVEKIVQAYNLAKKNNSDLLHKIINDQIPELKDTGSRFWTLANLEINKLNLELTDFVETAMGNIDNTIEGLTKVLLHENLAIQKINSGKIADLTEIRKMDLGVVVDDLATNSPFKTVFTIPTENLKLSDWRNIAAHHNYKIMDVDNIICEYGPKKKRSTFTITKLDLDKRLIDCVNRMIVLQIAHKFYYTENYEKIIEKNPNNLSTNERDEVHFLRLANSIYSEGYEIIEVDHKNNLADIILQDLTSEDAYKRSIHTLPFIYNLWTILKSATVKLEYRTKVGKPFYRLETTREDCEKVKKGIWTFDHFYGQVKQKFL